MESAEEVVEEADQYNGFSLIVAYRCSRTMVYATNRPNEDKCFVIEVSHGIHAMSNTKLDSPWPKAQRLGDNFKEQLKEPDGNDPPIKEIEKLTTNTVKVEEESQLPHIYPPELEYHLSSIFVEKAPPLVNPVTYGEDSYHERYLE